MDLLGEADVPASGGPLVLLGLAFGEQQSELERLRQGDELELRAAESASVTLPRSRARRKRM